MVESKVVSLELKLQESEKRLSDVELSRSFDSTTSVEMKTNIDALSKNMGSLRNENIDLNETIIDLQARSMRDNLLFFNFDEETSSENRKSKIVPKKFYIFVKTP